MSSLVRMGKLKNTVYDLLIYFPPRSGQPLWSTSTNWETEIYNSYEIPVKTERLVCKAEEHINRNCLIQSRSDLDVYVASSYVNQRTIGPVNAHLIFWPIKAQSIQNLENIW